MLQILLAVNLFFAFLLPVRDNDFGWHYRCGGKLCLTNEYSYFLPNYHWAYPSFLYDISLAKIFDNFGFFGISVFGAVIFTAIFLIYFFLLKGSFAFRIFFIVAAAVLSWSIFSLGYRSQILGSLFFVLELLILEKRKFWFLPLLFFLWANAHPSFFLGPLILIIYGVKKPLPFFFIISVAATLINPFGWRIYGEIIQHLRSPLGTMIAEWTRPGDQQLILLIISFLMAIILFFLKKDFRNYKFLLLIIFGLFAFSARRNLPLFYLTFFLFLSEQINWRWDLGFAMFPILISSFFFFIPNNNFNEEAYCHNLSLPCRAVQKYSFEPGNIFNTYEWGGYLIWKLPKNKIFVDGRMPAWQDENGESPYAVFLKILQTQPGWNEKLEKLNTKYLFIGKGTFLDLLLQKESAKYYWREEYRDEISAIYKRV